MVRAKTMSTNAAAIEALSQEALDAILVDCRARSQQCGARLAYHRMRGSKIGRKRISRGRHAATRITN